MRAVLIAGVVGGLLGCDPSTASVLRSPTLHGPDDLGPPPDLGVVEVGPPELGPSDVGFELETGQTVRIRFDEAEGSVARAESDRNFVNGQVPATAIWRPEEGRLGGALELNGDSVGLGNNDRYLPDSAPFTVAMWVRVERFGSAPIVWLDFDSDFVWVASSTVALELRTRRELLSVPRPPVEGTWHHLAVVQDFDAGQLRLWWDGENQGQLPSDLGVAGKSNGRIGRELWGRIDDFRTYERALEPGALRSLAAGEQ